MRLNIKSWMWSATAITLVGFANAQPGEAQPNPPASNPAPATQGAPAPDLTAQEDVNLPPDQMVKKAEEYIARMDQGSRSVRQQLSQARQERDVVKVLCLNDKLNQINVALSSAIDRKKTLDAVVKDNDIDSAKHEFTIIGVLRKRVETLLTEANQCIGEELGYLGETDVKVDIDPDIPDTDPAGFPGDPFVAGGPTIIPRPPASPG